MSKLKIDGGALTKAFIDEIRLNSDLLHHFNKLTVEKFKGWRDRMGDLVDIADFMLDEGDSILNYWMTKVFSFNEKHLKISVPKKLSPVDSQIVAKYTFSKEEAKIIKEILQEYDIEEYGEQKAAETIFSNSMKSISGYLSEIFETEYKIFTNKLDHKEKKGKIIIEYEAAGRIQGF
ncbi:MAG: hypothetical protein EU551_00115 [Promethearchaeota archaeon]|nr:MAG: hypothetical protein EU551_00115 [Candidatus Lokiarchaeota archaeon]